MVHACYKDFLKSFKPSAPNKLFAEGGPAWRAYKSEHADEIAKMPKCKSSKTQKKKKGKKGSAKKIRGSRKIKALLLRDGNFDNDAKAEIKRLLG